MEPLTLVGARETLDVRAVTQGGGITGHADAIRLAIARALVEINPSYKAALKAAGMLTRDPREVERKHYYRRKARKSPQYSKR
jgi:small subunit ribosomal protein S9